MRCRFQGKLPCRSKYRFLNVLRLIGLEIGFPSPISIKLLSCYGFSAFHSLHFQRLNDAVLSKCKAYLYTQFIHHFIDFSPHIFHLKNYSFIIYCVLNKNTKLTNECYLERCSNNS